MKTILTAALAGLIGMSSGCAILEGLRGGAPKLSGSPDIPAAESSVRFRNTRNNNTSIALAVKHLPPPSRLTPPASAYVAWVRRTKDAPAQNIGALVVSKDLKGKLNTVTALKSFELFVTAEPSGQVQQPTGAPLLWTNHNSDD